MNSRELKAARLDKLARRYAAMAEPLFGVEPELTLEQEAACLRYNFDADSKGDSGVKTLDVRMVTAAKAHAGCFPCMGEIAKGERHRVERALMDGAVRTCRSCAECSAAMAAFQLGADYDAIEARYSLGRRRADAARSQQPSESYPAFVPCERVS
jgi:hypothetical protein